MATMFPCCMSKSELNSRNRSKMIDMELKRSKHNFLRTTKMLLLGSGESGKSTFLKQMRILHGEQYKEEEIKSFKYIIYANIVKGMRVLIDARIKLGIEWEDEHCENHANYLQSFDSSQRLDEIIFNNYVKSLSILWNDGGIKKAFERRIEYQLGDSVRYFLNDVNRISEKDYLPSYSDILHSRKATKGISEHEFMIKNVPFKFVDVGGQRSQRQKWYQCFECVTSILFLVSSSEFDQVLFEDRQTNRLKESADIFETIVNNRAFESVSIILFLNKSDLLEEKIKKSNIADYFRDFHGNSRLLRDVQDYQVRMFNNRRLDDRRAQPLFHHFTTAVDTENIKYVFQAVKDTILRKNIGLLMLH